MSILSVYHVSSPELPNKVLTHFEDIASTLAAVGVTFKQLPVTTAVKAGASHENVADTCRVQIDQLMTELGHTEVEVTSVEGQPGQHADLRAGLLSEHQHSTDEVRYFLAGRGLVSLRIGEFVYAVLCEKNDLIAVPAGTRQWFDLGEHPRLVAIRLFRDATGREAKMTGETLSREFPGLDD